jgi:vacuolar-type H+-ATPase subunit I/STV1
MSDRERSRGAERRAEQIRRRGRSRSISQASRNVDEHLRQMNEQASLLDKRLRRHGEDSESWHRKWDDPS